MLKTLTLVLGLAAFAGCKTDAPESSSSEKPSTTATPSGPKPRSGKIDLPTLPSNPNAGANEQPRTEGERDAVSKQAREDRRAQRQAELDTNGDGEISEEERQAARAKREQEIKDRLDTNKDGVISDEERGAARHARAEDMHARLDRDGDGKVTATEMQTGRIGRMGGDMSVADANGDGQVTVDELDTMMKNRPERGPFRRGAFRRGGDGSGSAPSE